MGLDYSDSENNEYRFNKLGRFNDDFCNSHIKSRLRQLKNIFEDLKNRVDNENIDVKEVENITSKISRIIEILKSDQEEIKKRGLTGSAIQSYLLIINKVVKSNSDVQPQVDESGKIDEVRKQIDDELTEVLEIIG